MAYSVENSLDSGCISPQNLSMDSVYLLAFGVCKSLLLHGLVFQFDVLGYTRHSIFAWKIPWTEEPGRLQSMELLIQARLSDFTFTFHFHALEKEMATHSIILAWRIPGAEETGGLPSMGSHRVGHN